jgi:hypothetical protein
MRETYTGIFSEESGVVSQDDGRDTERQRVSGFLEHWGWEYNIDLCAENERITWEEIYMNWNVVQFLTKISYLKDKGKFEIALNGIR